MKERGRLHWLTELGNLPAVPIYLIWSQNLTGPVLRSKAHKHLEGVLQRGVMQGNWTLVCKFNPPWPWWVIAACNYIWVKNKACLLNLVPTWAAVFHLVCYVKCLMIKSLFLTPGLYNDRAVSWDSSLCQSYVNKDYIRLGTSNLRSFPKMTMSSGWSSLKILRCNDKWTFSWNLKFSHLFAGNRKSVRVCAWSALMLFLFKTRQIFTKK